MTKYSLGIEGMMCDMCEAHINDAIRKDLKVSRVESYRKKNLTEVLTEESYTEDDFHKVIDPTGYKLVSVTSEPYEKKKGLFRR